MTVCTIKAYGPPIAGKALIKKEEHDQILIKYKLFSNGLTCSGKIKPLVAMHIKNMCNINFCAAYMPLIVVGMIMMMMRD